jgi:hypothetical protein
MAISKPPSSQYVFDGLQQDAQIWERLLWSSGGLLEINKCRYCIIQWQFGPSGNAQMVTASKQQFPRFLLTEGKSGRDVQVPLNFKSWFLVPFAIK